MEMYQYTQIHFQILPIFGSFFGTWLGVDFSDTDFSLLTVGQLIAAIIYDKIHDTYHVFDSHLRAAFGNSSSNGASVLFSFRTLEELCFYIQRIHVKKIFNLTPVLITDDLQSQFKFASSIGKFQH